jgi:hypothetical protein
MPTQADPLSLHTAKKKKRRIGSLDADALKSSAPGNRTIRLQFRSLQPAPGQ